MSELESNRWGTRFLRLEIERDYRAWHVAQTARFNRAGLEASLVAWTAITGAAFALRLPNLLPWLSAIGFVVTVIVVALAATVVPAWRRWSHVLTALANAVAGVLTVAMGSVLFALPAISPVGAVIAGYFGFAILKVRPSQAAFGVAIYLALQEWIVCAEAAQGAISTPALVLITMSVALCYGSGLQLAIVNDISWRVAFRQERIIEAQKATIERQQALLEKELSHQVAERSRELGVVLAKSDVTLDVRRLTPGERFAERYRILSALGAGGMGAVYEVERVTDSAKLALKAVVGEVSGASAARFAREAEIGARVRHPNLISIVDVGVSSGVPFLVMELVRGGSLESQRARFGDVAWALPILKQIAEGLAALHDAGVVHRDLKPANVLLTESGAKISDFGISRFGALDEGAAIDASGATMAATPKKSAELTGTGVVMGTPLYMAPEGAKSARALDASADAFAFGILAYEMLTGRSPFPVPAFMLAMAEQPIPVPPPIDDSRVAAALRASVLACLAGDATQRPRIRAVFGAFAR